jgi:hypothetical protein
MSFANFAHKVLVRTVSGISANVGYTVLLELLLLLASLLLFACLLSNACMVLLAFLLFPSLLLLLASL